MCVCVCVYVTAVYLGPIKVNNNNNKIKKSIRTVKSWLVLVAFAGFQLQKWSSNASTSCWEATHNKVVCVCVCVLVSVPIKGFYVCELHLLNVTIAILYI